MKVGHVFTVEPMINLGSAKDVTWGDKWTWLTPKGNAILTAHENKPVINHDVTFHKKSLM